MGCRANDAMAKLDTPFKGQQVMTLLGPEKTTSLLVVLIV